MGIVSPSGNRLEYPFKGQILNRPIHDEKLVYLAKREGAEYLTKSRVNDVIGNEVILKNGKHISSKIVVGCGGPHDILRKKFWNETSLNISVNFVL